LSAIDPLVPHEWQENDVSNLLFWDCTGLVAIATGGGKSLTAVEAVLRSGHHTRGAVLVIAPKSTFKKTWMQTFERQGGITPRQINSTKDGKQAEIALRFNEPGVYLINHELFTRRDWAGVEIELCIADEAHKMSNYQMITKKKTNSGAWKLVHFNAKRRIAMSATPYRNNFSNIWTLLRWLYPDQNTRGQIADRSFWRWVEEWCVVENDYFAGKVVRGELVPGKLVSQIPCYIYHAKRQACCEFHPEGFLATEEPERIVRTVELTPAMKKAYKQLEEDYVAFLGENPLVVELPIVMRARLRQMSLGMIQVDENDNVTYAVDCESPKYDDLKDVLEQEIPGEPVLVVTHSKQFALVLAEKLRRDGYTVAEWHGDLKQSERDAEGERFEAGEAQIMVGTIQAMGTGTDFLQRVTQTIVWMSRTDDATDDSQTEGRLDRMGGLGRVTSIEIQAEGTYDEGVMSKNLQHALDMNKTLALSGDAR
jgi:superfamily II DNA or RNA helicase